MLRAAGERTDGTRRRPILYGADDCPPAAPIAPGPWRPARRGLGHLAAARPRRRGPRGGDVRAAPSSPPPPPPAPRTLPLRSRYTPLLEIYGGPSPPSPPPSPTLTSLPPGSAGRRPGPTPVPLPYAAVAARRLPHPAPPNARAPRPPAPPQRHPTPAPRASGTLPNARRRVPNAPEVFAPYAVGGADACRGLGSGRPVGGRRPAPAPTPKSLRPGSQYG